MKKHTLLLLFALVLLMLTLLHGAQAQTSYVVKIKLNGSREMRGELLYAAGDSIGVFEKHTGGKQSRLSEIVSIKIHRKGNAGRGIATGAAAGALIGALIGFGSYESPQCPAGMMCFDFGPGPNTLGGAMVGAIPGSIIGALVGTSWKEIKINADPVQFDCFKQQYGLPVQKN